ncbi:hypothetical protein FTV88_0987 [Heliorestis convoluta]|uniref:Uncharacterized protein n=1 Tax=Heliorestis convoluta TaxID=356322 RepID=A0A5Q2N046_9FIRM|nr:hypothetical protein FTV88_0987 [Heliorestis convoluta]
MAWSSRFSGVEESEMTRPCTYLPHFIVGIKIEKGSHNLLPC